MAELSVKERTLAHAERAMALSPESPNAIGALGAYYYRIEKDYTRANEIYAEASAAFPENTHFIRMQAHVARRMGEWERALELLNQIALIRIARRYAVKSPNLQTRHVYQRRKTVCGTRQVHARG